MSRSVLSLCTALLFLLISPAYASAATYTLGCGFGNPPSATLCNNKLTFGATGTSSTPSSFVSIIPIGAEHVEFRAEGISGLGSIGLRASSETAIRLGTPAISVASGSLTLDDVIFSSPDSDPILVALNLHVAGDLSLIGSFANMSKATVGGFLNGTAFTGDFIRTNTDAPNSSIISESKSGLLSDIASSGGFFSAIVTTADISVPVNVPVSVKISLDVLTSAGGSNSATFGFARADMLNTLSFATSGDVFTLPTGFNGTVDSVDGAITNNSYVVPEPATGIMLLFGMLTLHFHRNKVMSKPIQ